MRESRGNRARKGGVVVTRRRERGMMGRAELGKSQLNTAGLCSTNPTHRRYSARLSRREVSHPGLSWPGFVGSWALREPLGETADRPLQGSPVACARQNPQEMQERTIRRRSNSHTSHWSRPGNPGRPRGSRFGGRHLRGGRRTEPSTGSCPHMVRP